MINRFVLGHNIKPMGFVCLYVYSEGFGLHKDLSPLINDKNHNQFGVVRPT